MPSPTTSISRTAVSSYESLGPLQRQAIDKLEKLEKLAVTTVWNVDKEPVFTGVAQRVENPGLINQGTAGLCGPASMLFDFASRDPVTYATFVIDLYQFGKARLGTLDIKPSTLLTNAPIPGGVPAADWIPMASIRNSENDAWEYISDRNAFQGITLPSEMANWFRRLGYTDVIDRAHLLKLGRSNLDLAKEADRLFLAGYRVVLFVNADGVRSEVIRLKHGSLVPNHWVVLTSHISLSESRVAFSVFSWGSGSYDVPQYTSDGRNDALNLKTFLDNFYGFVAARF